MAASLVAVMQCTGGEGSDFASWLQQLVEFTGKATTTDLSQISNCLQIFCDFMKSYTRESVQQRLSVLGPEFSWLFEKAQEVVGECGQILGRLRRVLEKQVLCSQTFFQEAAGSRFLPEPEQVDGTFFADCITFGTGSSAEETKDTLLSMMQIVEPESGAGDEAKKAIEDMYGKHVVQLLCCKAMDALLNLPEGGAFGEVRCCVAVVEQCFKDLLAPMEAHAAAPWAAAVQTWASKNLCTPLFAGRCHSKMVSIISGALDSQPEGIDVSINTRNVQKLRGTAFSKSTREACVGCLEDMAAAVKSLEDLWASGVTIGICKQGQAGTIKAVASQLSKIRSYSSTIHGLNLILHRFPSKSKIEKTAMVREFLGIFQECF